MSAQHTLIDVSEKLVRLARKLHLEDVLDNGIRCLSIEEIRKILRWLRNLQATEKDAEGWLDHSALEERTVKVDHIHQLMLFYAVQMREAKKKYPSIVRDPVVVDATSASAALTWAALEYTLITLPPDDPESARLEAMLAALPQSYDLRLNQSIRRLVDLLAAGIERLTGIAADQRSPTDRLLEISGRISAAAHKLRSIDTLEEPAREESVELAREILRRLKNIGGSDKTMKEMRDAGGPDEKAAIADKIEEMVDSYRQLLQEAALDNPDIMDDPRIKEANDAVGGFAHSIKLMAAKEIPTSGAAAQQISADVTRMPDEWKNMEDRTMSRLLDTMDGGLEKAVGDIQLQQEEQEKAEEQAQNVDTQLTTDSTRRRKRRGQRSGIGGAKQQRVMREINADDYVLKQGRFSEQGARTPDKKTITGLDANAMDAVKALGNSLRNLSNEAATLPPPTTPIAEPMRSPNPAMPDALNPATDQSFTAQVKDQRPPSNRPRSNNNSKRK